MHSEGLWKTIEAVEAWPYHLRHEDRPRCVFAFEFTINAGFRTRPNDVILNFKKEDRKQANELEWRHRRRAVETIARDFCDLLEGESLSVAAIPGSKTKDHPAYSSRFQALFRQMRKLRGENEKWRTAKPIELAHSIKPAHEGGYRSPEARMKAMRWRGFKRKPPKSLLVVDDVITSGGSFEAYRRVVSAHHPEVEVFGAFWARAVEPCPFDGISDGE